MLVSKHSKAVKKFAIKDAHLFLRQLYFLIRILTVPKSKLPLKNVRVETTGCISCKANIIENVSTHTNTGIIYL
jgi:hypothetical protein